MHDDSTATACSQDRIPTLSEIQQDWRLLDLPTFPAQGKTRLISHEAFTFSPGFSVEHVKPGRLVRLFAAFKPVYYFVYAWQLLREAGKGSTLIVNGAAMLWLPVGLLNRLLFRGGRRVLCWDIFVETNAGWKRRIMREGLAGMTQSVLWSRAQVPAHAAFLDLPEDRFIFIPFKANHSKGSLYDLPIGSFIFAGGNGKRDYPCLVEAVRDTGIPVIISATDPLVRQGIEQLPNVIVLGAPEPAFAKLQAASRFVVIPMIHTGVKGGGEANFCNAMWHGKPVIAVDNIAASDYVIEGVTGYVVPSGDSQRLRERILELWHDPDKVVGMGQAAKRHVEDNFTHQFFIRRLLRLAWLLAQDGRDQADCG